MGLTVFAAILLYLFVRTVRTPSSAIAGCLCLYGIEQWGQATIPQLASQRTFTNFVIGALVTLALGMQFVRGNVKLKDYPKVGVLVLMFLVYAYASSLWASRDDLSATRWFVALPYIITFVVLAPLLFKDTSDVRRALADLVIIGAPLAGLLTAVVRWEERWIVIGGDGAMGYANPLAIAEMAGYVILVAVLCRRLAAVPFWALTRWVAVAVCIALAVKSGSRGQVFSVLIVLLSFWPLSHRRIDVSSAALSLVGCIVIGVVVLLTVQEYWGDTTRWSGDRIGSDVEGRLEMAQQLLNAWWNAGPYAIAFGLGNGASLDPKVLGFYPHILALEIVAEEGAVGLMIYISILSAMTISVVRAYRYSRNEHIDRETLNALAALLVYTIVLSFKQGNLLGSFNLWMLCIMVARYSRIITREYRGSVRMHLNNPDRRVDHGT